MDKTLLAAVTGVAFGAALCVSIFHLRAHQSRHPCHGEYAMRRQVVIIERPATPTPPPVPYAPTCEETQRTAAADGADGVLSAAQREYVDGNYACSSLLAHSVMKESPVRAWRIIGAAACNIKDTASADDAFRHLDAAGRQYLVYVCHRNDVVRHRNHFVLE